ncbi:hypothetical protein AK830_g7190 [Neonectria ditissima]|uniref:Thioesterase domain-containing protein n=1 Tax=Neonectria ditissima TaxID=78410 RepID=A0A0P7BFJ9_9HYPO|nr:hypothetical protein AK830_g7190 [Neonectria ditissima]
MTDIASLRSFFSTVPWCARLLEDSSVILSVPACRQPHMDNTLWKQTFNTADTVPAMLVLHHKSVIPESPLVREVNMLVSLGGGLSGFPGTCHGGILQTILDESMVTLILTNVNENTGLKYSWFSTVSMNTVFMKPVRIPATLLAVVAITRVEERKLYLTTTLKDGSGVALVKADAVFVGLRNKL